MRHFEILTDAEIGQFDLSVAADEYVFGFDIAMDLMLAFVDVLEPFQNLSESSSVP